jgi:beta-galactosidase GanA
LIKNLLEIVKIQFLKPYCNFLSYTKAVQNYYDKLLDVIYPFLYKNGGPILMVQIENEYGNLKACDKNYTYWLRDLLRNKLGDDVVLYTSMYFYRVG